MRLSGQDSARGTFSTRHAVLYDAKTGQPYVPLMHLAEKQARICIYNSLLSEAAVLGFDYGYSLDYPNMLCLWEAQFGDFVNGAQTIIDQFIVSAESKWQRPSGLVMLLLLAVLVPSVCLLWFMNQAVKSERSAARQKLFEAYRGHLALAVAPGVGWSARAVCVVAEPLPAARRPDRRP